MLYGRVTGPFHGYHVAVYACEIGELGERYLGYYKICAKAPPHYFEAESLLKGCCNDSCDNPEAAMQAAQALAQRQIDNMPVLDELAAYRENRPLFWFEREVLEGPLAVSR